MRTWKVCKTSKLLPSAHENALFSQVHQAYLDSWDNLCRYVVQVIGAEGKYRWKLVGTRGRMVFPDWRTGVEKCESAMRRGSKMFSTVQLMNGNVEDKVQ